MRILIIVSIACGICGFWMWGLATRGNMDDALLYGTLASALLVSMFIIAMVIVIVCWFSVGRF